MLGLREVPCLHPGHTASQHQLGGSHPSPCSCFAVLTGVLGAGGGAGILEWKQALRSSLDHIGSSSLCPQRSRTKPLRLLDPRPN